MDIREFKRIKKQIDYAVDGMEKEALENGTDVSSPEFKDFTLGFKRKVLMRFEINYSEYEAIEDLIKSQRLEKKKTERDTISQEIDTKLSSLSEDISAGIAELRNKKISWEEIEKRPFVLSTEDVRKIVVPLIPPRFSQERIRNLKLSQIDRELAEKLGRLEDEIQNLKLLPKEKPERINLDEYPKKKDLEVYTKQIEKIQETLGEFKKEELIQKILEYIWRSVVPEIIIRTAPDTRGSPTWGQIVGTLSGQTDLQTALDTKVPYTGATADVDLGIRSLAIGGGLMLTIGNDFVEINADTLGQLKITNTDMQNYGILDFTGITTADKTFTFPDVSGTFALREIPIVNKTAAYTATATDNVITCDATIAAFTITLPTASGIAGRVYTIKKVDSSVNAVTVDGNAAETIDGDLTKTISTQYTSMTIVSNGSNWLIV